MEGLRAASWYRHATSAEILCVGKKQVVADAEWIRLLDLDWIADRVEKGLLVRLGEVEDAGGLGTCDMVSCGSDGPGDPSHHSSHGLGHGLGFALGRVYLLGIR